MPPRERKTVDLTGIRQRRERFQVRIFGGIDPATGKQLILTGSAATEVDAIALRDSSASRSRTTPRYGPT
jgi:integrase